MPISFSAELQLAYLRAAIAAQTEDERIISENRTFYDGDQGIQLTDRQKEYLGEEIVDHISRRSFANIAKRTVEIPLERLAVEKIAPADDTSTAYADTVRQWWEDQRLTALQTRLYRVALRDKCGAIIIGYNQESQTPTFTLNELWDGADGTLRLHYDPSTGELMYASKRWVIWNPAQPNQTGKMRLTLYFSDSIWRYEETVIGTNDWRLLRPEEIDNAPNPQAWTMDGTLGGEPIGLPVIPFWNDGDQSEIDDVWTNQKAINKGLADLLSSADMHGFPLLYMTGASFPLDETGKEKVPDFGPGRMLTSTDPQTKVGRIEPADLQKVFEYAVMAWMRIAAFVKGWPMHLFDRSIQPPSGEALRLMESSLVKQVEDKQLIFTDAWRDTFQIAARAAQVYGSNIAQVGRLDIAWKPAQAQDQLLNAQADQIRWAAAEIPRIQRWREAGYSDEEIQKMLQEEQEEQAQFAAQAALMATRRIRLAAANDAGDDGE